MRIVVGVQWPERSSCEVVANVLDCDIAVNQFELQSRYYIPFGLIPLGIGKNPPPPLIPTSYSLKLYRNCSIWIALALNNPMKVDMPVKKPTKCLEKRLNELGIKVSTVTKAELRSAIILSGVLVTQ